MATRARHTPARSVFPWLSFYSFIIKHQKKNYLIKHYYISHHTPSPPLHTGALVVTFPFAFFFSLSSSVWFFRILLALPAWLLYKARGTDGWYEYAIVNYNLVWPRREIFDPLPPFILLKSPIKTFSPFAIRKRRRRRRSTTLSDVLETYFFLGGGGGGG